MNLIKYLLLTFIAQTCLAEKLETSEQIIDLEKKWNFEICDIEALSDGGTTSICLFINPGKLWVINKRNTEKKWSAVYEDEKYANRPIAISDSDADTLLLSWLKYRYSCTAILNIQSDRFVPSTREDLIAATIVELIHAPPTCSD